jgi:hypothetical protein
MKMMLPLHRTVRPEEERINLSIRIMAGRNSLRTHTWPSRFTCRRILDSGAANTHIDGVPHLGVCVLEELGPGREPSGSLPPV